MAEETRGLSVGQNVPDFEMDTFEPGTGKFGTFRLADARDRKKWTVLVFYPAAFTFVCPTELADLGKKHPELAGMGCEVVSVSTDTKFSHFGWHREEKLLDGIRYPMGADPKGEAAKRFGVYDERTGLAFRGTFIISPDGVLVGSEVNYFNVGRNMEELVRKVKAFQYVRENPNEVCPASWEPGKKTLRPSEALVGRVFESL